MATDMLRSLGDIHVPQVAAQDPEALRRSRTRAALWVTLIFWLSSYALLTLATALSGNPHFLAISGMRIVSTLVGLGFCYLIHLLLRHPRLDTTKKRLIALAIAAPICAELSAWAADLALAAAAPDVRLNHLNW